MSVSARNQLRALIASCGPITVAAYMHYCLFHCDRGYYSRGGRIGRDFTTAPEISQIFGELIGIWCVNEWRRLGRPRPWYWVELGPGRGVLAADALRAMKVDSDCFASVRPVMLETSSVLRREQKKRLASYPGVVWVDSVAHIPSGPCLVVANEFFDCLPVRRLVRDGEHWREQMVGLDGDGELIFGLGPVVPCPPGPQRDVIEISPAALGIAGELSGHVCLNRGRVLMIDYGYGPAESPADEFRGFRDSRRCDPIEVVYGDGDLTADVDFGAIACSAVEAGGRVDGPITQRDFLLRIGLRERAQRLFCSVSADQVSALSSGIDRLVDGEGMGGAFRVLAVSSPDLGSPAGFVLP